MEIWKDIDGYNGLYQISNIGRVKSLKRWNISTRDFQDRERIMTPTDNGSGYLIVSLMKNKVKKNHYVHRLVASAFCENPSNQKCVNHIDYDKSNNNCENLEWCSQLENVRHSANRMRHRKSVSHTNTGHQYICYNKRRNKYRVIVDGKEYPSKKTLEDAIEFRDLILKGVV